MKHIPLLCLLAATNLQAASFLVEAEQFSDKGGWGIDTQFIEPMGSPYLIAHGLGKPVADLFGVSGSAGINRLGNENEIPWREM